MFEITLTLLTILFINTWNQSRGTVRGSYPGPCWTSKGPIPAYLMLSLDTVNLLGREAWMGWGGTPGSFSAKQLKPHGPANTTFWILSIDSTEFSNAPGVVEFLNSLRHPTLTLVMWPALE
jgi:hypothetical protein